MSFDDVQRFLNGLLGDDLHAKRILSLAGATLGSSRLHSWRLGRLAKGWLWHVGD